MDKNKILDAAAKLVAKGSYDKAIKEYQKVLDADPKDVRVLHKLGELYEKKNDNAHAAAFFTRVADGYASDGFSMKAIALYKKVLKLDPNLLEVNLKLAELHQQHQLMSEAMAYYQAVANQYDKAGDVRASLDTLKKMVELDPDNVASRNKLGELYARENMNAEAIVEFQRAAEYLKRNARFDDYLRVAERISALEPHNVELARELAAEYLSKSDQKRALAKLQICFKADPRDVTTLNLLAQAFQGLGQTSKTISVYKELAKVFSEQGRPDEVAHTWSKIEQIDPEDPDLQARKAAAPAHAPSGARSGGGPAPQSGPEASDSQNGAALTREQLQKLLTETDVYVKYGLHDKALEHLRRVFSFDPESLEAHEKAYHIYVAAHNAQAASEQLLNVLRLCTRRNEVQRAQPYLTTILHQAPNHPEVPAFLAVLRPAGSAVVAAPPADRSGDDAILVDSSEEEIIVADAPDDALAPEDDLALAASEVMSGEDVVEEPALAHDAIDDEPLASEAADEPIEMEAEPAEEEEEVRYPARGFSAPAALAPPPPSAAPSRVLAPPPPPASAPASLVPPPPSAGSRGAVLARPPPPARAPAALVPPPPSAAPSRAVLAPPPPAPARGALAPSPPAPVVIAPPPPAPVSSARNPVVSGPPAAAVPGFRAALTSSTVPTVRRPPEPPPPPPPPLPIQDDDTPTETLAPVDEEGAARDLPAADECDEASFLIKQGLLDEAREILDTVLVAYPSHERAAELMERLESSAETAEPPPPVDAAPPPRVAAVGEEGRDAFDLAAELAEEISDLGQSESPPPASGDEYQVSVEEVFSEFKKGLQKIVKPEDVDTHYDLGIAYKEMGLMDDAIAEFSVARQGCPGKKKELDCLTMIGLLHMQKGNPRGAIDAFKEALTSEHATPDVMKALRFELGSAWHSAGSAGKALHHFKAVAASDPNFRDVGEMLDQLARVTPEDDPLPMKNGVGKPPTGASGRAAGATKPPGKTGKVGYV